MGGDRMGGDRMGGDRYNSNNNRNNNRNNNSNNNRNNNRNNNQNGSFWSHDRPQNDSKYESRSSGPNNDDRSRGRTRVHFAELEHPRAVPVSVPEPIPELPVDNRYANVCRGIEQPSKDASKVGKSEWDDVINLSDSNNWFGARWVGPTKVRSRKIIGSYGGDWRNASGGGSVVIPNMLHEYSRDGVNWYGSFLETFSADEIILMEKQEDIERNNEFLIELERSYLRSEYISNQHYLATGEEDAFAWAQRHAREYDEYAATMEVGCDEDEYVGYCDQEYD